MNKTSSIILLTIITILSIGTASAAITNSYVQSDTVYSGPSASAQYACMVAGGGTFTGHVDFDTANFSGKTYVINGATILDDADNSNIILRSDLINGSGSIKYIAHPTSTDSCDRIGQQTFHDIAAGAGNREVAWYAVNRSSDCKMVNMFKYWFDPISGDRQFVFTGATNIVASSGQTLYFGGSANGGGLSNAFFHKRLGAEEAVFSKGSFSPSSSDGAVILMTGPQDGDRSKLQSYNYSSSAYIPMDIKSSELHVKIGTDDHIDIVNGIIDFNDKNLTGLGGIADNVDFQSYNVSNVGAFTSQVVVNYTHTTGTPQVHLYNDGSGDSGILMSIIGDDYYVGVDNSDSDRLKIGRGSAIGTGDAIEIRSDNEVIINHIEASTGKAVCVTSAGTLGVCSTAVDGTGSCTCA